MATLVVGAVLPHGKPGAERGCDGTGDGLRTSRGGAGGHANFYRLVDRCGAHSIVLAGLLVMLSGCILLAVLPLAAAWLSYVGALAVLTAATCACSRRPTIRASCSGSLPGRRVWLRACSTWRATWD
ncbi:hypothetical protein LP420_40910 [Massilia sp. B-10]|nr:hypothetical protein LP420_40910 [Massilia sp. B-10]